MNQSEFEKWTSSLGMDSDSIAVLSDNSIREIDINMDIHDFDDTKEMNEDEDYPIQATAVQNGFFVIGSCCNGDVILLDLKWEPGTVHFACHEELDESSGEHKIISVKVAPNLCEFVKMMSEDNVPYDYFEALEWEKKT